MASSYAQTGESAGYAHTVCSAGATDAADTGISRAARPVMCSLDDGCCHGNNFLSRERAICLDHLEPPHLTPKTTREAAPPHLTPQTAREADRPLVCVLGACSPKHGRNRRQAAELRRAQLKKRLRLDLKVRGASGPPSAASASLAASLARRTVEVINICFSTTRTEANRSASQLADERQASRRASGTARHLSCLGRYRLAAVWGGNAQ